MSENKIELIWQKPCKLENLDNFFGEHKGMGGLYLWVFEGKQNRIRYIGEAADFQTRFNEHLKNITHGLYTAIKCSKEEDLADKYNEIVKTGAVADQTGEWLCYHPKPATFNGDELKKYIEDVKKGIDLSLDGFLNCYFLFAEIKYKGASADEHLRKEVESIFMKKTKEAYLGKEDKKCWCNFRKNTSFWGTVSKYHDKKQQYIFNNTNNFEDTDIRSEIEKILKDIHIEIENGQWIFPKEG